MNERASGEPRRITKQDLRSPAGFLDWPPSQAIALERMLQIIRQTFELAGFPPFQTPLVERISVLTAKAGGEVNSQIYGLRLLNPAENSPTDDTDLALRFDNTVPFARFVAANHPTMLFPARRYTVGSVVRGERPRKGRYREFLQADVDVIGDGVLGLEYDAEMIAVLSALLEALGLGPFTIRINDRRILGGLLERIGCDTDDKVKVARKAIDDLEKLGDFEVIRRLVEVGITEDDAKEALELLTVRRSASEVFDLLRTMDLGPSFAAGLEDLEQVMGTVELFGVPEKHCRIDLALARGLDYYTGTVFEAGLDEYPKLGSIAGGGRYDNLANSFTSKHLPGVGFAIGVTRLLQRLIELGIVKTDKSSVANVLLATEDVAGERERHVNRARILRAANIPTEAHYANRKLGAQIAFAHKQGIPVVVFSDKSSGGSVVVKNLVTGKEVSVREDELLETVRSML